MMSTGTPQINVISWMTPEHHGLLCSDAQQASWVRPSPDLSSSEEVTALVGKPVRYFQRMPDEARYSLCAASLAIPQLQKRGAVDLLNTGMLAGRFDGTLDADMAYYQDYLASGRTLARGNMFVYTLPTSVAGSLSVVLGLGGPAFYLQQDQQPLADLLSQARLLIASGQASAMLVLWSDSHAAACIALDGSECGDEMISPALKQVMGVEEVLPLSLAGVLQSQVEGL